MPHYVSTQSMPPPERDNVHEHPMPLQRQWLPMPTVATAVPQRARFTDPYRAAAMPLHQQTNAYHGAHTAQADVLSLAAQMLPQESPISEQGPPTCIADSPWINDAPGIYWDDMSDDSYDNCRRLIRFTKKR